MKPIRAKFEDILRLCMWYIDYILFLFSLQKKEIKTRINNILLIELLYIGDLIVITPTLRALRNKFKDSKITLMTLTEMKDVLSGNKNIDKITSYKLEYLKNNPDKIINELNNKYDLAIILHPHPELGSKISKIIYKANIPY